MWAPDATTELKTQGKGRNKKHNKQSTTGDPPRKMEGHHASSEVAKCDCSQES